MKLDLLIAAADVFNLSGGKPSRHVSAAIHLLAFAEWVKNKALVRQLLSVEITGCEACAGDIQLSANVLRHRIQVFIEDVDLYVGGRPADRHNGSFVALRVEAINHAADSCLRRSILIEDLHVAAKALVDTPREFGRQSFTAHNQ